MNTSSDHRILFIAPVEPWCRENGSSLITADVLAGLSEKTGVDVMPVFLRTPPPGYTKHPPVDGFGVTLGVEGLPRWLSVARALALRSSPMRMRFDNRAVAGAVLDVVNATAFVPSVVHVEHLPLVDIGIRIARFFRVPLVYRAHNIETQLWERRLGVGGRIGDAITRYMARREADAAEACDLTLCISDVDLEWINAHAPTARAELLPPALLVERYDSVKPASDNGEPRICFVGGLEWTPNEVGLRWFVDHVLPLILAEVPAAKLAVLARGASERPWLTSNPSVRIVQSAGDAATLFASSRVSIAPLLQGGGVRIKILESLALGCPVVATPIGGEGLALPALTATDDVREFAAACVSHLAVPATAETRTRLRSAVDSRHGAGAVADRLTSRWIELSERNARIPAVHSV